MEQWGVVIMLLCSWITLRVSILQITWVMPNFVTFATTTWATLVFFFFFFGRMSNLGFSYYQVLIFYYLCSHKNDFSFMVPSNCYRAYFLLTNGCIKVYFYKRRDRIIGGSHEFQHPKTLCDLNKFYLFD